MNAFALMAAAAGQMRERLLAEPGCLDLPAPSLHEVTPEFAWANVLLSGDRFRRAHVETLHVPGRIYVLHVCLFPHLDDASPIFGFDVVAGSSKVTGIFLDLSAVGPGVPALRLPDVVGATDLPGFVERRQLPPWGDVFSDDMLAIRPVDIDEVRRALSLAAQALDGYLKSARRTDTMTSHDVAAGQMRYMTAQRRNDHTLRMLAGLIGMPAARRFIDEVLFPPIALPLPDQAAPDQPAPGQPVPAWPVPAWPAPTWPAPTWPAPTWPVPA